MIPGFEPLCEVLRDCPSPLVAVSGGVDSLTLASAAHRALDGVRMVHARSPAVAQAGTARVRRLAERQGWDLVLIDAGEFSDPRYLANPVDRCFFCKSNLYARLIELGTGRVAGRAAAGEAFTPLSGTNTDDLNDWRPGLAAAEDHGVRHPFVEAGMAKADVRDLARALGLGEVAELPASPCLASRMETGLPITAPALALVERVESWLAEAHGARVARCRLRHDGIEIELGGEEYSRIGGGALIEGLRRAHPALAGIAIRVAPYRRGAAFVGDRPVLR